MPPGKKASFVIKVNTSEAALEKAEWPERYPAKGGVTKEGR